MPNVEKVSGGRVYVRLVGQAFTVGDRAEVSDGEARYLCDERGDFERVEETDPESEVAVDYSDADDDVCGAELTDGGTCDRPADECPYHGDQEG